MSKEFAQFSVAQNFVMLHMHEPTKETEHVDRLSPASLAHDPPPATRVRSWEWSTRIVCALKANFCAVFFMGDLYCTSQTAPTRTVYSPTSHTSWQFALGCIRCTLLRHVSRRVLHVARR